MPEYFRKFMIPRLTLLFLGYSLEDWNFRVIWEGVLANYAAGRQQKEAYAIMQSPKPEQVHYWRRRNIDILDLDLTEFAKKLAQRFNLEIPQLGIQPDQPGGVG